jgi:hypothetical protein
MLQGDAARARLEPPIDRRRHLIDHGGSGLHRYVNRPSPDSLILVYCQRIRYHDRTLSWPSYIYTSAKAQKFRPPPLLSAAPGREPQLPIRISRFAAPESQALNRNPRFAGLDSRVRIRRSRAATPEPHLPIHGFRFATPSPRPQASAPELRVPSRSLRPTSTCRFSGGPGLSGSDCWHPKTTRKRAGWTGMPEWLSSSQ